MGKKEREREKGKGDFCFLFRFFFFFYCYWIDWMGRRVFFFLEAITAVVQKFGISFLLFRK